MQTYRTLSTFLVILAMAPVYAAPLNPDDWEVIEKDEDECPAERFQFSDGTLIASGNTNGNELFCIVEEGTRPMVNGSGMSVTLHFDTKTYLNDTEAEFLVFFRNDNSTEYDEEYLFHRFTVFHHTNDQLNIFGLGNTPDDYYELNPDVQPTTTIKVNCTIRDNHLCFSYELNGKLSEETVYSAAETNPTLDWRPSFGLQNADTTVFTVTDVTFIPASVPEPTTATLSLLALAGLAARRRRK